MIQKSSQPDHSIKLRGFKNYTQNITKFSINYTRIKKQSTQHQHLLLSEIRDKTLREWKDR
jgi:hypothetical protein